MGPYKKIQALGQLLRIPLVFTALSNISCAYILGGGWSQSNSTLALLLAISACLYSAGMVLNDLSDRKRDSQLFPHRPLPSGRVTFAEGLALFLFLCGTGLFLGFFLDRQRWPFLLLTLGSILLYDLFLKKKALLAPLSMGACRFFHFALGMGFLSPLALLPFFHTISLTYFSLGEEEWKGRSFLWCLPLGMVPVLLGAGLWAPFPLCWYGAILPLVFLLFGTSLFAKKHPLQIGKTIGHLVRGFILLDLALLYGWTGDPKAFLWASWLLFALVPTWIKER